MTQFKKAAELLQQLRAQLGDIEASDKTKGAIQSESRIKAMAAEAASLDAVIAKMVNKAAEQDPDKQVYGKAMREKVRQLADSHRMLSQQLETCRAQVAPFANAERQDNAAKAEALEKERQEQLRRDEEEAAKRAAKEQERKQAAEAAAAEAAAAETRRLAEEARVREEKRKAAQQAALDKERQEAKAALERSRLETQRVQEQVAKQKAANQLAKQAKDDARRAALGRAPSRPLLNPEGALLHLSGGREELDSLLLQAGERQLVVVDYSTSWCGPCRMMEPVLVTWARELAPRVVFVKVDAEAPNNRQLAASAGVRGYPTFHIHSRGSVVGQVVGADRAGLRAKIDAESRALPPVSGTFPPSAVALAHAMGAMKADISSEAFLTASRALLACATAVVSHPEDPRLRSIKVDDPEYQSTIGRLPKGTECMAALGFRPAVVNSEEVLLLESPSPELRRIKQMLEVAMGAAARTANAPATSPTASNSTADSASAAASPSDKSGTIPNSSADQTASQTEQPYDELTEEEQLEQAIRMSLGESDK